MEINDFISYVKKIPQKVTDLQNRFWNKNYIEEIAKAKIIYIFATGTSYNAALAIKSQFIKQNHKQIIINYPSQFNKDKKLLEDSYLILISQSGKTQSINMIARWLDQNDIPFLSVSQFKNSPLGKTSKNFLLLEQEEEKIPFKSIGYVNTYSTLSYLFNLKRQTFKIAQFSQALDLKIPSVKDIKEKNHFVILYKNGEQGLAAELSLKIKELAWLSSCSFEIEDFCHGNDAFLSSNDIVFFLNKPQNDDFLQALLKYQEEVKFKIIYLQEKYTSSDWYFNLVTYTILSQRFVYQLASLFNRPKERLKTRILVKTTKIE